jgi:outer membrane protein TolC
MKRKVFIWMMVLLACGPARAQVGDDVLAKSLSDNDISQELPSLSELLTLAEKNSPAVKQSTADVSISKRNVKSEKRSWMQHLSLQSDLRYGMFGNLVLSNNGSSQSVVNSVSDAVQTRYSVGVLLQLPFNAISDRRNTIKIAEDEQDKALQKRREAVSDLRQQVIKQYNEVLKEHRLMVISNANLNSSNLQEVEARKEFVNGKISIEELARMRQLQTKAQENFENNKSAFQTAFLILQEIVGIKLKLKE